MFLLHLILYIFYIYYIIITITYFMQYNKPNAGYIQHTLLTETICIYFRWVIVQWNCAVVNSYGNRYTWTKKYADVPIMVEFDFLIPDSLFFSFYLLFTFNTHKSSVQYRKHPRKIIQRQMFRYFLNVI